MTPNNDQWLKDRCNRYTYGKCTTMACLHRGGYSLTAAGGYDPEIATCEAHEILKELEELRWHVDNPNFDQTMAEPRRSVARMANHGIN